MPPARTLGRAAAAGWSFTGFGLRVSVPWNALLGIAVIALLWYPEFAGSFGPVAQGFLAVMFGCLLMVSVLIHEYAHAFTAKGFGYHVTGVTLWAMGGYTQYRTSERHSPSREAAIAAAGPAATLALAVIAWVIAQTLPAASVLGGLVWALAWANILVGVFNLLPGSPLDGGAIVKAIVWAATGSADRGAVVAAWVGRVLAVILLVAPFALSFVTGSQPSLALILIALMLAFLLWTGASSALRNAEAGKDLRSIRATQLASPVVVVPDTATIADVRSQIGEDRHVVVVDSQQRITGVVLPAAARAVPDSEQPRVNVLAACTRIDRLPAVSVDATAWDVLQKCQDEEARYVAVMADNRPAGLIDTDEAFVAESS